MIDDRYEFAFAEGTVYVWAKTARRGRHYGNDDKGIYPRVYVSTDPESNRADPKGWLKIRGRAYRIATWMIRLPDGLYPAEEGRPATVWEASYGDNIRSFTNSNDTAVAWDSSAHKRLDDIVADVLDRLDRDRPDWQNHSMYALAEKERDDQAAKVRSVELALDREREKLRNLAAKADDFVFPAA